MEEPTFWQASWVWIKRLFRWVAAPIPAILLVIGAVFLVVLGFKNIQIGGLLSKLLGKEDKSSKGSKIIDIANTIPKDRVDDLGRLIPPGVPDATGQVQAVVLPIKEPGLFDDPKHIQVILPDSSELHIILPEGVTSGDVDKVLIIKPEVYVVSVKDTSGVIALDIDRLLNKYK